MKSYTDLEQSKKLEKILRLESADMCFLNDGTAIKADLVSYKGAKAMWGKYYVEITPAWSLAALLGMLNDEAGLAKDYNSYFCYDNGQSCYTKHYTDAVDAVFEMILKLHKLRML